MPDWVGACMYVYMVDVGVGGGWGRGGGWKCDN